MFKKYFWKQILGVYILLSLTVSFAITLDTAIDFGKAYPDKELTNVNIYMNNYNEYWIELLLMIAALPGIIITVIQQINRLNRTTICSGYIHSENLK